MAAKNSIAAESADPVLVVNRVFDAPRELVRQAFTELERMNQMVGDNNLIVMYKINLGPSTDPGSSQECVKIRNRVVSIEHMQETLHKLIPAVPADHYSTYARGLDGLWGMYR